MIQLTVLNSGRDFPSVFIAKRLPVVVGRSARCDFRIEEDGVWDRHFVIRIMPPGQIGMEVGAGAHATVNGNRVQEAVLRNGDLIETGCVQMRFGLGPVQQRGLSFREVLAWTALIGLCLSQVVIIYAFLARA